MAKMMVCTQCGSRVRPKSLISGSFAVEVLLWLALILPGLLYSLWRLSTRRKGCPVCGASELVPPSSPRGVQILREFGEGQAPPAPPKPAGFQGYCQYRFDGKGRGATGHVEDGKLAVKGADPVNLAAQCAELEVRIDGGTEWETREIRGVEVEDRSDKTWGVIDLHPPL